MGEAQGNMDDAVNNDHKTEKKWKRDLKYLKKKNKMIFSMANKSVSCHEIKKIKKIKSKSSRKRSYSISDISSSDSDSDSSLYIYNE